MDHVRFFSRRDILRQGAAAVAASTVARAARTAPGSLKIVVLTGSPHRRGTSFLLADEFIRGAREAGHDVFRFDAAFSKVIPCIGCDRCGLGSRPCVFKDDYPRLRPHLEEADVVAFVTPLYYFGFSAQIKAAIDRFYEINSQLHEYKRAVLLATAWNDDSWTMDALKAHYRILLYYMGWKDAGTVYATGCGVRSDIENSDYPRQAYELGRFLA